MALLQKETLKLIITREDTGQSYSMSIKDKTTVFTPGAYNRTSITYSKDNKVYTEDHLMSREVPSLTFQAMETNDPSEPSHLKWNDILNSLTVRFTAEVVDNPTAKIKSYDIKNATMEIGANENGSYQVTLRGNITNIVE